MDAGFQARVEELATEFASRATTAVRRQLLFPAQRQLEFPDSGAVGESPSDN